MLSIICILITTGQLVQMVIVLTVNAHVAEEKLPFAASEGITGLRSLRCSDGISWQGHT